MKAERWQQVDQVLQAALDLEPGQRAAFLAEACAGDESLRQEVESLLALAGQAEDFLGAPPEDLVAEMLAEERAPGERPAGVPEPKELRPVYKQTRTFPGSSTSEVAAQPITEDRAERNTAMANNDQPQRVTERINADQAPTGRGPFVVAPGVTLDGRYLIEQELGRGGVGAVFLARDQKLHNAPVVIKVLLEHLEQAEHKAWFEKKFRQEAEALARIDHPGVVRALDVGELPDGRTYLVMQYVSGTGLRSVLRPQGMELERVAKLIRQMGQALSAAHAQGVVHRDLKPENVMLQQAGDEEYAKLIDFGIATVLETPTSTEIKTTKVAGTIDYMAPEQLHGKPTAASDVYALGVIAYEMVTGRRPFNPDSPYQLLELQRAGVRVKPCDLRPSLPAAAQAVILKALAYDRRDRYAQAKDFSEALAQALTAEVGHPELPETMRVETQPPQRTTRLLLLAGLLAVAAIGAAVWWRLQSQTGSTANGPQVTPAIVPTRELSYWLTVQRDPKRYPGSKPFTLPGGETLFSVGDHVRLNISSPQAGYLYVINEGPAQTNGLPELNVLFPDTITNGGSAEIKADQTVQIPQPSRNPKQDWFIFDQEEGLEKIWLVWSGRNVPELEAVKGWANPKNEGEIGDPGQIKAVAQYLAAHAATKPEKDEVGNRTQLKGKGEVLVGLVKLEHH